MTGTMYKSYVAMLSTLTTIGLRDDSIHWGAATDFAQHNIEMQFINSKHHVRHLNKVVDFLRKDTTHFACVFCASKKGSDHLCTKLEDKLNEAGFDGFDVDVVHVHGSLQSEEKFILIRIFCEKYNVPELSARVLLATAAANVGIDNHLVLFIMNMGWTRDLLTYFQQRGRACRLDGQEAVCIQIGDTGSFVGLMWTILHTTSETKLDDDVEDVQAQLAGINCASSPMKTNNNKDTEERKGPRNPSQKHKEKRMRIDVRRSSSMSSASTALILAANTSGVNSSWHVENFRCPPLPLSCCLVETNAWYVLASGPRTSSQLYR